MCFEDAEVFLLGPAEDEEAVRGGADYGVAGETWVGGLV